MLLTPFKNTWADKIEKLNLKVIYTDLHSLFYSQLI